MGNAPVNVEVDPQALAEAKAFWHRFTSAATYGVVAVAILLSLMAIFLV